MFKKYTSKLVAVTLLLCALCAFLAGCSDTQTPRISAEDPAEASYATDEPVISLDEFKEAVASVPWAPRIQKAPGLSEPSTHLDMPDASVSPEDSAAPCEDGFVPGTSVQAFDFAEVPPFSGSAWAPVHGNTPFFNAQEIGIEAFESYSPADQWGRCGIAWGCLGLELMPQEEREAISEVTPSGWNQAQVDGGWLYHRCHLIGFQLAGENAREDNLITGTSFLNAQGMLPFENLVADYIKETGNHVMYRATPFFVADERVCRGVLLEGLSVEDEGAGVSFCVFAYNVFPGVEINYADGSSTNVAQDVRATGGAGSQEAAEISPEPTPEPTPESVLFVGNAPFIGNRNTGKFHQRTCGEIGKMSEKNKVPLASVVEAQSEGYVPCKKCNPM